jgi:hypothetical protein
MERLASLWSYAPFIAGIVVMVAIIFVVVLVVRSHRSVAARSVVEPLPSNEIDPDLIDSSHIGFAPLVGSVSLPSRERGQNGA